MKSKTKRKTNLYKEAVGRRKTSIARVRLSKAKEQKIVVNSKTPLDYFGNQIAQEIFLEPLDLAGEVAPFDISIRVKGGGKKAQAEAIRLGIARALVLYKESLKPTLKKAHFLTRDSREKERKKPGLKGARRAPQWQKR